MIRAPRISKATAGDRVFDALHAAGEAGATWQGIAAATGLTRSQIGNGIEYVKDVLASANTTPLAYANGRYYLDPAQSVVEEYQDYRTRIHIQQLDRALTGTVIPMLQKLETTQEDDHRMRWALKTLRRAREDLADLVAVN